MARLNTSTAYLAGYVDGIAQINTYHGGYEQAWSEFILLPEGATIDEALAGLDIKVNCHYWMDDSGFVGAMEHSKLPREFVEDIFRYWLFDLPDGPDHSEQTRALVIDEIWSGLERIANFKRVYEVRARSYPAKKRPHERSDAKREDFFNGGTFVLEADDTRLMFCFSIVD